MNAILVIEDNLDNMTLVEDILEDAGYDVVKAFTAESGLNVLEQEKIDLVLMDISLPAMSGYEATRVIKSKKEMAHIPVVALTAHAMANDKAMALSSGCSEHLTKPLDENLLLETITKYISRDNTNE